MGRRNRSKDVIDLQDNSNGKSRISHVNQNVNVDEFDLDFRKFGPENGNGNQRPEILDFKVFIGDSIPQPDPRLPRGPVEHSSSAEEALVLSSYFNRESQQDSHSGTAGGPFPFYFYDSGPPGLVLQPQSQPSLSLTSSSGSGKKSVTFEQGTVFIERDMSTPFWQDFLERRMRRKLLKQRKRMLNQGRPMTLFDLLRMVFSKKSRQAQDQDQGVQNDNGNVVLEKFQERNPTSLELEPHFRQVPDIQPQPSPFADYNRANGLKNKNSHIDSKIKIPDEPIYLNNNIQNGFGDITNKLKFSQSEGVDSCPDPDQDVKSNSKGNKLVHSMRCWWSKKTVESESERKD